MKKRLVLLSNGITASGWETDTPGLVAVNMPSPGEVAWRKGELLYLDGRLQDALACLSRANDHVDTWGQASSWSLIHAPSGLTIAYGQKREQMLDLAQRLFEPDDVHAWSLPVPEPQQVYLAAEIVREWYTEQAEERAYQRMLDDAAKAHKKAEREAA